MKLDKVDITYFRCFESLSIPLHPEINVFVGVNGAGKSSILDAIAIALYDIVAANGGGNRRHGSTLRPTDIYLAPGAAEHSAGRSRFVTIKASAVSFYEVGSFSPKTPTGEPNAIDWLERIQYAPPKEFIYPTKAADELSDIYKYFAELWQESQKADAALIPFPVVAYYRADRRLSKMPTLGNVFGLPIERQSAYIGALNAGANYQATVQWFYLRENHELREKLQFRNDPDYELPELRAVRAALKQTIRSVEQVFFEDNPPSLKVRLSKQAQEASVLEIDQLSDGYRNLLALILDFARRLAQAHPNWPNPLDAPGILLIDEIELHLHPGWQQEVIPNLRKVFPNTQLIVATHSPQVLTTVRKEHVHVLTQSHNIEPLAEDIGTFGSESAFVLERVFGIHTRPQKVETVEKLNQYLLMVESRQHASAAALALRETLNMDLGTADPSLIRADMRIRQLEILAKR